MSAPGPTLDVARPGDEPALRRLLRETPFAGVVPLTLEREPDFHAAAAVEGDRPHVLVARGAGGAVEGLAARTVRTALVNGAPARLGYLGQLRVASTARGGVRLLREGFRRLAAARRPDELPFDFTSVASDNAPARRLLEAGLPGLPRYRPLGEVVTLALAAAPARSRARSGPGRAVARGSTARLGEVAALLREDGARRQLAPCPGAAELASPARARGLAPEAFLLGERGGRLEGVAALWDQRGFKQVVVRGYPPLLGAVRPLLGVLGPVFGLPRLPPVGRPLAAAFLAFLSVPGDDPDVLDALLDAALPAAAARGLDALVLGLAADHPLRPVAARRRHRAYRTTLYAVHFEEGAAAAAALDGRPLGPEVATL